MRVIPALRRLMDPLALGPPLATLQGQPELHSNSLAHTHKIHMNFVQMLVNVLGFLS